MKRIRVMPSIADRKPQQFVLVDTARSSLVDEDAVRAALNGNRSSVFATDVFPEELPPAHDLFHAPGVPARP